MNEILETWILEADKKTSACPSQVEIFSGANSNSLEILVRNIKMAEFVLFWSLKFPKCP